MTSVTSPAFMANVLSSSSLAREPRLNTPRSPPWAAEGPSEDFFATSSKLAPARICLSKSSALASAAARAAASSACLAAPASGFLGVSPAGTEASGAMFWFAQDVLFAFGVELVGIGSILLLDVIPELVLAALEFRAGNDLAVDARDNFFDHLTGCKDGQTHHGNEYQKQFVHRNFCEAVTAP